MSGLVLRAFSPPMQQPFLVCRLLSRTLPVASHPFRAHRFVRAVRTIHKHGCGFVVQLQRPPGLNFKMHCPARAPREGSVS